MFAAALTLPVALLSGAALAVGSPAPGTGFAPPRTLIPRSGLNEEPVVAVGPTGRTVVVWRNATLRPFRARWMAAIGTTPAKLGRPVALTGVGDPLYTTLVATPDGAFVLCAQGEGLDGQPRAIRCARAPAGHRFGPGRVVRGAPPARHLALDSVIARPDGSLLMSTSQFVGRHSTSIRWASAPRGSIAFTADRPLATVAGRPNGAVLTTGPDGTVAASWTLANRGIDEDRRPVVLLLAPGARSFGAPVRVAGNHVAGGLDAQGGHGLAFTYSVGDDLTPEHAVVRGADGRFGRPVAMPRAAPGYVFGTLMLGPGGSVTALATARRESGTDCGQQTFGAIGVAPLGARRTTQTLSTRGQLADDAQGVVLADGTRLVAWGDVTDGFGRERLEYALAPAGRRFGPARPIGPLAARGFSLATGGGQTVLAWVTGSLPEGPSHVVVTSLTHGRPAPVASRPKHPRAPCG